MGEEEFGEGGEFEEVVVDVEELAEESLEAVEVDVGVEAVECKVDVDD